MKIRVSASTGSQLCRKEAIIEIPDTEVDKLTPEEVEKVCQTYAEDWLWNILSFHWSVSE